MKLHIFILLFFCRLFTLENQAMARGPAVEPVTGLSIEEYNETFPDETKGFNFNKTSKDQTNNTQKSISRNIANINRAPERSIESLYDKTSSEYAFLVILGILPFVIWFGIMKTIDSIEEKYRSSRPRLVRTDNDDNDDDDNYPWVS